MLTFNIKYPETFHPGGHLDRGTAHRLRTTGVFAMIAVITGSEILVN